MSYTYWLVPAKHEGEQSVHECNSKLRGKKGLIALENKQGMYYIYIYIYTYAHCKKRGKEEAEVILSLPLLLLPISPFHMCLFSRI